jgi:hypothetical protein
VQCASMSTKLAVEVGNLGLLYPTIQKSIIASNSTSESDSEKNSDSDSEEEEQENDDVSHSLNYRAHLNILCYTLFSPPKLEKTCLIAS